MLADSRNGNRLRWILGCLLLAGLALRLGAAAITGDAPPKGDAALYADIAQNIAFHGEFSLQAGKPTANRAPLYPAFLAVFRRPCPGTWHCARLAQALLDTSSILLVYLFGLLALQRRRAALAGAILYALHPVYIAYTAQILSEPLFLWLWLVAVCLLLKASEPDAPRAGAAAVGAGVAMGLAILCRPNFMLFPVGAGVLLAVIYRGRPAFVRRVLVAVGLAYLTLVPWAARNRRVMDAPIMVAVGGGDAFWFGAQLTVPDMGDFPVRATAGMTEAAADAEMYRQAKLSWKQNWPKLLAAMPGRFLHFWLTSHSSMFDIDQPLSVYRQQGRWGSIAARAALWAFHLALLALGAWGLWSARENWTVGCTLALLSVAYYSLHVVNAYEGNRYHLPALALCLAFAGSALTRAASGLAARVPD